MSFSLVGTLLEGCVLSVLSQGDTYGYALTQTLQKTASISESTLYPVLRRLQNGQYLETYDKPYGGRNRRYYRITQEGQTKLAHTQEEWCNYRETIDTLLTEGSIRNE